MSAGFKHPEPIVQGLLRLQQCPNQMSAGDRVKFPVRQVGRLGVAGKIAGPLALVSVFGAGVAQHCIGKIHARYPVPRGEQDFADLTGAAAQIKYVFFAGPQHVGIHGFPGIQFDAFGHLMTEGVVKAVGAGRPVIADLFLQVKIFVHAAPSNCASTNSEPRSVWLSVVVTP